MAIENDSTPEIEAAQGPFGTDAESAPPADPPTRDFDAPEAESTDEITQFQEALHARLVEAIKTVYDPEIPVDIYELGLIYEIEIDEAAHVAVSMTLTSPACPVAGSLVAEVEDKVSQTDGVKASKVELVWDPPWTPELMSESAKLELGMM